MPNLARFEFPWAVWRFRSRKEAVAMGGTANLAVLGGNLPPSLAGSLDSPFSEGFACKACGLVARRNGQVARSTLNRIAWIRLIRIGRQSDSVALRKPGIR